MSDRIDVENIKEYWPIITGVVVVLLWIGRLTQQVWDLRRDPKVTVVSCERQQNDCRLLVNQRLGQGETEFAEIKLEIVGVKQLIAKVQESGTEQHRMVIKHLLDLKK